MDFPWNWGELDSLKEEGRLSDEDYQRLKASRRKYLLGLSGLFSLLLVVLLVGSWWISPEVNPFGKQVSAPKVLDISPQGKIDDKPDRIQIQFNHPMVSEDQVGELDENPAISLDPSLDEAVLWHSPFLAEVVTQKSLPPGTRLTVRVPEGMETLSGANLQESTESTLLFKPLSEFHVSRSGHSQAEPELRLNLRTDAPLDWSDLKKHLVIEDENGRELSYGLPDHYGDRDDRLSHTVIVTEQEGVSGQTLTITLKKGIVPSRGNVPLEEDIQKKHTVGEVRVHEVGSDIRDNQPVATLRFNHEVPDIKGLKEKILIDGTPAERLEMHRWRDERMYVYSDQLDWGSDHEITIKQGMRFGYYELKDTYTKMVSMESPASNVELDLNKTMKNWAGGSGIPVEHVNADTLHITVYDLYDNNLVHFANQYRYAARQQKWFKKKETIQYRLPGELNEHRRDHIQLEDLVDQEWSGPKLLKVTDPGSHRLRSYLLMMTNLGLTVHRGDESVTVLATDLESAQPESGVNITLYSDANQRLASGKTNRQGVLNISDVNPDNVSVAIGRKGKDLNYLTLRAGRLSTGDFDIQGDRYLENDEADGLIYGERELYRPGETLRFQALIRHHDLSEAVTHPVKAVIRNASGDRIYERTHNPDEHGRVDITHPTSSDATTGNYSLWLQQPHNNRVLARQRFQVEEFVPDRIEATVESDSEWARPGEEVKFTVKGEFLHGEPTKGNEVQNQSRVTPIPFESSRYPDYRFGDHRIHFDEFWNSEADKTLDDEGKTEISLSVDEGLKPPGLLKLFLESTVMDMGARGVTARDYVKISPYPHYVGTKFKRQDPERAEAGDTVHLSTVVVDHKDRDVSDVELDFTLYEIRWQYSVTETHGGVDYDWNRERIPIKETTVDYTEPGQEIAFELPYETRYQAVLEDPESGAASVQNFSVGHWWLRGDGQKVNFDRVEVNLDKDRYKPGETAKVSLKAPFEGTAYVFLEGEQSRFLKQVEMDGLRTNFSIDVEQQYTPNQYVTVYVLRGVHTGGHPAFRSIGIEPLFVEAPKRKLTTDMITPEEVNPGETIAVTIEADHPTDRSVDGVAALSVVDDGILQQTNFEFQDAYDRFLRQRGLSTQLYDVYSMVNAEEDTLPGRPLQPSGAARADQAPEKLPEDKQTVRTISDWYPDIPLEDGEATVDVTIPEFSGRLSFRSWLTSDRAVGTAKTKQTVQEPIIMEPTFPRALSPGDEVRIPVELMNTTDQSTDVTVRLRSEPPVSAQPNSRELESLGPDERRIVYFDATVDEGLGNTSITLTLESDIYTRTRRKILPVRPAVPPTTMATLKRLKADTEWTYERPQRMYPSTESHQFMFSSRPKASMFGSLNDLIRYPRGNVSTIVDQAFPLLYLRDLLEAANWDRDRQEEIGYNINEAIRRLLNLTLPSGALPRYPGQDHRHSYTTQHATHFLVEADRAGFAVPSRALDELLRYQKSLLNTSHRSNQARARAAYILARGGEYHEVKARELLDEFTGYKKYYLMAALAMAGHDDVVDEYARAKPPNFDNVDRSYRDWYYGPNTARASVLMAMLDVDPSHEIVEALAIEIMKNMQEWNEDRRWRYWYPGSLSRSLVAIGRYYHVQNPVDPDFDGTLELDGNHVMDFSSEADTVYRHEGGFDRATVNLDGEGTALTYHYARGVPRPKYREERQQDFKISHRFYTADGSRVQDRTFEQGEIYVIESLVETPVHQDDLYVEDMLPGGFELENQRLATDVMNIPALDPPNLHIDDPTHMDIRDDRMLLYFDSDGGNTYRFRYVVRAVSQGEFVSPALGGGALNDPSVGYLSFREPVIIE